MARMTPIGSDAAPSPRQHQHRQAAAFKMTELLGQSHEVLHEILGQLHPRDLARVSKTCSFFHLYIKHNRLLWRDVYLRHYDTPKEVHGRETAWEQDAKDYVALARFCQEDVKMEVKVEEKNLEFIAKTIIKLADNVQLAHAATAETRASRNRSLLESLLTVQNCFEPFVHGSNLYHAANGRPESCSPELSQLLAKVHCLHGTSQEKFTNYTAMLERITRQRRTIPFQPDSYARSRVYDLRLYNEGNKWGPWSDDGEMRVNWEMVECIMIDLGFNAAIFTARTCKVLQYLWRTPFKGVQPNSYTDSYIADKTDQKQLRPSCPFAASRVASDDTANQDEPDADLNAQDPFGVSGTWQRIVCFLDYSDFDFINRYQVPPLYERRPPIDHEEAMRLIFMELRVTRIEPLDSSDLPRVHFKGISRSMHAEWDPNASSRITGFVELTPEREVRWSTLSHVHGEARWRSEGVQIGGIKSQRGVCGTWFDKDHDRDGPCGPTAFWKITDSIGLLKRTHGAHMFEAFYDAMSGESDDDEFEPGSEQSDDGDEEDEEDEEDVDAEIDAAGGGESDVEGEDLVDFDPVTRAEVEAFEAQVLAQLMRERDEEQL